MFDVIIEGEEFNAVYLEEVVNEEEYLKIKDIISKALDDEK